MAHHFPTLQPESPHVARHALIEAHVEPPSGECAIDLPSHTFSKKTSKAPPAPSPWLPRPPGEHPLRTTSAHPAHSSIRSPHNGTDRKTGTGRQHATPGKPKVRVAQSPSESHSHAHPLAHT